MSAPDYLALYRGDQVPPRFATHPHTLALLPIGMTVDQVGSPGQRFAGVFLVDPDCASVALNDDAFDRYLRSKTPVLVYASRVRDLRPFLRRSEQFRRRGVTVEVLQ